MRAILPFTAAAVLVMVVVAVFQTAPGYMDAEYYYSGGLRLAQGFGFTEPFLWNYLDQPAELPHASHTYWMPLGSILAFVGIKLTGASTFLAARWPFMLLAALIPWVTFSLAIKIGAKHATARLAGWFAVFPGFYLVFTTLTETFVLYMLGGSIFFLALSNENVAWLKKYPWVRFAVLGLVAAWMHAARADGILWLGMAGLVWLAEIIQQIRGGKVSWQGNLGNLLAVGLAYGLVMTAWYARNLQLFGSLLSPGGSRTLWLTDYDQTFLYPVDSLTMTNWLAAGWAAHLQARWTALGMNLKNLLAVQGMVFLLPFMAVGMWRARRSKIIRFGALGWLLTFLLMTVVFPFSGSRGGYLHSGAAFQPLLWACGAYGLEIAIDAGARMRGWSRKTAWRVFSTGTIVLVAVITGVIFWQRVVMPGPSAPGWASSQRAYRQVGETLEQLEISEEELFVVNNPPGFYLATGRPSIVIPDGGLKNLALAAQKYGAKYLVLDTNNPKLDALYQSRGGEGDFTLIEVVGSIKIYQIQAQP